MSAYDDADDPKLCLRPKNMPAFTSTQSECINCPNDPKGGKIKSSVEALSEASLGCGGKEASLTRNNNIIPR